MTRQDAITRITEALNAHDPVANVLGNHAFATRLVLALEAIDLIPRQRQQNPPNIPLHEQNWGAQNQDDPLAG